MVGLRTPAFRGRFDERQVLDRALDRIRRGDGAVWVIGGEAGIGKTALLRYCARQAAGCRVVQIVGAELEMELPFAALHQMCAPMTGAISTLPEPQARALRVVFGLAPGDAPDRFIVSVAVLRLLAEVAASRPLVCLVDDAQWLDEGSLSVLGFVARRLSAEHILLVFAVRGAAEGVVFDGLPTLTLDGLADEDAHALLAAAVPGHLDPRVADRLVAETSGNPLALQELVGEMSAAELAGFAEPTARRLSGGLQEHYVRRVRALPEPARRLMLLAAADPTGDATLLWRAGRDLGVGHDEARAAAAAQLLQVGSRVQFRHPLVRSAAYATCSPEDRRAAHAALAAATDADVDQERRVWHLAAAARGPDEQIAAELERTAAGVQARAGMAAAAAFLRRSVTLTADAGGRHADRALAAADAYRHAGAFDAALGMLAEAEAIAITDLQRARIEQLQGQVEQASNTGPRTPVLLLQAAKRLESLDVGRARDTYLDALWASLIAGRFAEPGGRLVDVARAARSVREEPPEHPRPCDLLLDGLATMIIEGRAAAAPTLRRAIRALLDDETSDDVILQAGVLGSAPAIVLWDLDHWEALSTRHVELTRASGALAPLAGALNAHRVMAILAGDLEGAKSLSEEETALRNATGTQRASYGAVLLAAYRGIPEDAASLISANRADAIARGEGLGLQTLSWATSVLENGLGHYADAAVAAEEATDERSGPIITAFALPELVEAAVRSGKPELAEHALRRLSAMSDVEGADWAAGLEARSRALVTQGADAEHWYCEAVDRLGDTRLGADLARARLLYGEWLRRQARRLDARSQLRAAYDMFSAMGADAFAERARRELLATGEKVRRLEPAVRHELTAQEEHIAQLARDGRTNVEIGAELFLSGRTVEWHLAKVFTKLGISSRRGLIDALPTRRQPRVPEPRPPDL